MTVAPRIAGSRPAVVLALIVLWLGATSWMRPLMLPDEGRYVGVAWEMLRSRDWLTPTLDGLPYFHKPPLFYWITAGAMSIFGLHEWAARAAPLLGASLGAFAMYLFVRRWTGLRAARLSLVALLAQPLFFIGGQFANLDMLVAGCVTAAIVLAAHAALSIERGEAHRLALAGAYAMAAAGVLAKGLIGIVMPALVIAAWLLTRRRWRVLWALVWWPGLLFFVALAAPWFVAMQQRFADFAHYFFVVQHFQRYAAGGFNNVQPFWFFPVVLLLVSLPWLPWLARLLRREARAQDDSQAVRLLMVLWVVLVVLFFSLPKSKLLGYVLPAVPPLAVLMAEGFLSITAPTARTRRGWLASVVLSSTLSVAVVVGLTIRPPNSLRDLATALRARHGPGEPVYMLGNYYFDVPFYARLRAPTGIVDNWQRADVTARDNWRKELADASQFANAAATQALVLPDDLAASLCGSAVSWVIGPAAAAGQYPFLQAAAFVSSTGDARLWRVETAAQSTRSALGCGGQVHGGPADR